jgi:uncharacterized membrane protein YfcA
MLSVPFMMYCNVSFLHSIGTSAAISLVVAVAGAIGFIVAGLGEPGLPPGSLGYVYIPHSSASRSPAFSSLRSAPGSRIGCRWAR